MNILEFGHEKARKFFLKEESYFNFDLPSYFTFQNLLKSISTEIEGRKIEDFYKNVSPANGRPKRPYPSELEGVNHLLLNNKDGKYAWRPFQLIHPALYVAIVHEITKEDNWNLIVKRFKEFQENKKIRCQSIPLESQEEYLSDNAAAITNWWQKIEQESLELALQYDYVLHTDISNCYGSIYTHSIPWALHTKPIAKQNRSEDYVGNTIDKYIRDMSYGQTNGIPQGSILMDFIAEMILGYADLELTEKIDKAGISDYVILRYRDDYRVFTNNPQDADKIAKFLTEILIGLGMSLSGNKTFPSNDLITDSIKPDKLYWISEKNGAKGLQGHLLLIHRLAEKFPNSGSLRKSLDKFFNRIKELDEIKENVKVIISILIDIAYRNPRTYPIACGILSKLLSLIEDDNERDEILHKIRVKFSKIPNTGHIKIWLQRVTIKIDRREEYEETLCKKVNDRSVKIWNSDWLNQDINDLIDSAEIIDEDKINEIDEIIKSNEIQLFNY
ncbi:Reverse transcriptase [Tenacibaculum litopenaei]|uniref:RNA-directed DNA polymerase n=1 Tax=Tenacibaculum litopenaei TaxID=396016 RepID=UPI00389329A9